MSSRSSAGGNPLMQLAVVGVVILMLFASVGAVMAFESVDSGHVKVVTERGEAESTLQPGNWYWVNFLTKTTHSISVRPKLMKMVDPRNSKKDDSIRAVTSDQTQVSIELAVRYKVSEPITFYSKWKNHDRARKRLIRTTVRSAVYTQAGSITLENISSAEGRTKLRKAATQALTQDFKNSGIKLLSVDIRAVQLPRKYLQAVSKKQQARQRLKKAEIKAERKKVLAKADAKANEIRAESLSPEILKLKYIKSLDKTDTVYVPVGSEEGLPTYLPVTNQTANNQNTDSNNRKGAA